MKIFKKKSISISAQKAIYGFLFSLPFTVGFILFFLSPFIFYIVISFSKMSVTPRGLELSFNGLENMVYLFTNRIEFLDNVIGNIKSIAYTVPAIILYSFFISIILNEKFRGRFLARAIFFLPVIIASGALSIMNTDQLSIQARQVIAGLESNVYIGSNSLYGMITSLFGENSLSKSLINVVNSIISSMDSIVNASGVQILIFLAGLQTVPSSFYEAAKIDGASNWENFWKITFPILSPILLVNTAYTIIDCLAAPDNWVIKAIYDVGAYQGDYTLSASMGTVYFSIIFVVLGLAIFFMSKRVYYEDR